MNKPQLDRPSADSGTPVNSQNDHPVTDKRGFAKRWLFSPRHIDNLILQGLPHLKIGERRVRIIVADGDKWMKERFGTQRRKLPKAA